VYVGVVCGCVAEKMGVSTEVMKCIRSWSRDDMLPNPDFIGLLHVPKIVAAMCLSQMALFELDHLAPYTYIVKYGNK
jgi:hypothetical protein